MNCPYMAAIRQISAPSACSAVKDLKRRLFLQLLFKGMELVFKRLLKLACGFLPLRAPFDLGLDGGAGDSLPFPFFQ
jgi:hypothetical protein